MPWLPLLILAPLLVASTAAAEEQDATLFPVPDYGGGILERERLLGDPGGQRSALAERGVQIEVDFTQVFQGIAEGRNDGEDAYTGTFDYVLKVDVGKLGLWPGGFLLVRGETLFGDSVNGRAGAVVAHNTDALFPVPGEDKSTLTDVNFTQFLHPSFAIALGKLSTLDGDANAFAHGRGVDQFMNLGNVINPVGLRTVPYAALGAAAIWLPREETIVQLTAIDTEDATDDDGFDSIFEDGTTLALEMKNRTRWGGLDGHQLLAGTWSDKRVGALGDPRIFLDLLPGVNLNFDREQNSWSIYANFYQYVYQPESGSERGLGVFGRVGVSDEDTNPIPWFVGLGVGMKGLVPGRERDQAGIGYWVAGVSDQLPALLDLDDESHAFELYYNAALAPWLFLTGDLQVVEPALRPADTAVVLGGRLKLEF